MENIINIARKFNVKKENLISYGPYIAKIDYLKEKKIYKNSKLVVVTSITPTKAGEGKTCTAIGLTQALGKIKKNVSLCLREPSLGPVFGIKGGATGNGKSQVLPAEEINLHFTGDIHAVTSAHNLLASLIDNHIVKGNRLNIDPSKVIWKRVLDINDRELRYVTLGLKKKSKALRRSTGFIITAASEIMAVLGLSENMEQLRERINKVIVAYDYDDNPVQCGSLNVTGSLLVLLRNALKPNLVQTSEGQPVLIHTGPFANIAHGNNSIIATKLALSKSEIVVTESGFGSDLGMEKLFDIVLPQFKLKPSAVVIVVSVRALKHHGRYITGKNSKNDLEKGIVNLGKHIDIVRQFGIEPVIAVNKFPQDKDKELNFIKQYCSNLKVSSALSEVVLKGSSGGMELAEKVAESLVCGKQKFKPIYDNTSDVKQKISLIAKKIYGAGQVKYSENAEKDIKYIKKHGFDRLPVNIAKTHLSLTNDSKVKGCPSGWDLFVNGIKPASGAGFLIVYTKDIRLMPGLPQKPAAEGIDITSNGKIKGLF